MVDTVKVGDQFNAPHADTQLRFTVTELFGRRAVMARSDNDPDWGVVERAFTWQEVIAARQWEETMAAIADDNAAFWATVTPAQVLHYHNGFGEYVRCVVNNDGQLQPVALVGNWTNSHADYFIEKIVGMTGAWRPHCTTVFEAPGFVAPRHKDAPKDPRGLAPLAWRLRDPKHGVIQKYALITE